MSKKYEVVERIECDCLDEQLKHYGNDSSCQIVQTELNYIKRL